MSSFSDTISSRYRLLEALGQGATSTVYLAEGISSAAQVVLKVHRIEAEGSPIRRRMQQEIELLERLPHPRIVSLKEWFEVDGFLVLVFPYEPGRTLKDLIPNPTPRHPGWVRALLIQILEGLTWIHRNGMIHRDLKPENLFMTEAGSIRILDLGLARDLGEDLGLTATGNLVGTPAYLSPDLCEGNPPDPRDDLYSLGVLAYEYLTGEHPFEAESLVETLKRQLSFSPDPVGERVPGTPPDLSAWVAQALAKDRSQRFPSAEAAREALEEGSSPDLEATFQDLEATLVEGPASFESTSGASSGLLHSRSPPVQPEWEESASTTGIPPLETLSRSAIAPSRRFELSPRLRGLAAGLGALALVVLGLAWVPGSAPRAPEPAPESPRAPGPALASLDPQSLEILALEVSQAHTWRWDARGELLRVVVDPWKEGLRPFWSPDPRLEPKIQAAFPELAKLQEAYRGLPKGAKLEPRQEAQLQAIAKVLEAHGVGAFFPPR